MWNAMRRNTFYSVIRFGNSQLIIVQPFNNSEYTEAINSNKLKINVTLFFQVSNLLLYMYVHCHHIAYCVDNNLKSLWNCFFFLFAKNNYDGTVMVISLWSKTCKACCNIFTFSTTNVIRTDSRSSQNLQIIKVMRTDKKHIFTTDGISSNLLW